MFEVGAAYTYNTLIRRRLIIDTQANLVEAGHRANCSQSKNWRVGRISVRAPGVTLAVTQSCSQAKRGVTLSISAGWNTVCHFGLFSRKVLRASKQGRPDIAARRQMSKAAKPFIDPMSPAFLDEAGVNTKMARFREPPSVPVSAISSRARLKDGVVLVLNNFPAHKVAGASEATSKKRAPILYLQRYSDHLNQIKRAISKLKALLPYYQKSIINGIDEYIARLVYRLISTMCSDLFRYAG